MVLCPKLLKAIFQIHARAYPQGVGAARRILGQPRDQMAGLLVVEVSEGQLLKMLERLPAHLGHDADSERMTPIGDDHMQRRARRIDQQEPDRGQRDQAEFSGR